MSWVDMLDAEGRAVLGGLLKPRAFQKGECLVRVGDPSDGCCLIDRGIVRVELELNAAEVDTDPTIGFLEPGALLGEMGILDNAPRSASALAHTDVETRWLTKQAFETLILEEPRVASAVLTGFACNLAGRLRAVSDKMASFMTVARVPEWVNETIARANQAQRAFATWPEERVMPLLRDMANAIAERAEGLARDTVEETGMGVIEHKIVKIRFGSLDVLASLEDRESVGLLSNSRQRAILEVASPVGVVLGLIPVTNPIPTLSFKALISLKSRNALIASIHRGAVAVGARVEDLMRDVLQKHGAPQDLIQVIRKRSGRQTTMQFMQHDGVALTLATGGPSMVKAAYSSGTPAIGVGPGNAPCWVSAKADLSKAAELIVGSKSFDNGIICGSENNLLVDESVRVAFFQALEREGAVVLRNEEVGPFTKQIFDPDGKGLRRSFVGQSADSIAMAGGVARAWTPKLIVIPLDRSQLDTPVLEEKLAPVLSAVTVKGSDEAIALAHHILVHIGGIGHTAIVHSEDDEEIRRFGEQVPASRILVNSPGAQGCIGLTNALTPSLTLGCGTFGGGSTTDNVSFQHLLNIRRIAYAT